MSRGSKQRNGAPRVPFSFRRHVVPPLFGFLVMTSMLVLLNVQWVIAQANYYFARPAPLTSIGQPIASTGDIDQTAIDPSAPSELIVPKIGLRAPLVLDEPSYEEWKVQLAMRRGVVHYGATALPGQPGNTVILGHSSAAPWMQGNYKFVFTLLHRLEEEDIFMINYKGTQYTYKVAQIKVVPPTDVAVLDPTPDPMATLITCTPVGTTKNRLVIRAEQISPVPAKSDSTAHLNDTAGTISLPGNDNTTSLTEAIRARL